MTAIFGGNSASRRAAEQSRRQQEVAQNAQLAELNRQDERTGASRRNPRGRRLFVSDATQKSNLS